MSERVTAQIIAGQRRAGKSMIPAIVAIFIAAHQRPPSDAELKEIVAAHRGVAA